MFAHPNIYSVQCLCQWPLPWPWPWLHHLIGGVVSFLVPELTSIVLYGHMHWYIVMHTCTMHALVHWNGKISTCLMSDTYIYEIEAYLRQQIHIHVHAYIRYTNTIPRAHNWAAFNGQEFHIHKHMQIRYNNAILRTHTWAAFTGHWMDSPIVVTSRSASRLKVGRSAATCAQHDDIMSHNESLHCIRSSARDSLPPPHTCSTSFSSCV